MIPDCRIPVYNRLDTEDIIVPISYNLVYIQNLNEYAIVPKQNNVKYTTNTYIEYKNTIKEHRNLILPINITRANIISKYIDSVDVIRQENINDLLLFTSNEYEVYDELYNMKEINTDYYSKLNLYTNLVAYYNQMFYNMIISNNKNTIEYKTYDNIETDKYTIVSIPKEIYTKIAFIEEYFEELKNQLKLNTKDGFYYYNDVPVICCHLYMLLDKVSLNIITDKCYDKGFCRFCGQALNNYNDVINDTITTTGNSLLIQFCISIDNNIDYQVLLLKLYSIVNSVFFNQSPNKNVLIKDLLETRVKIDAFSGIIILKIIKIVKDKKEIKFKRKELSSLLDKIAYLCATVGWNESVVKETLKDESIFKQLSNINDVIMECIYKDDYEILSTILPISILFDLHYNYFENNEIKVDNSTITEFQKAFLKGIAEIEKYNMRIILLMLSLWKYEKYIKLIEHFNKNALWKYRNINIPKTNQGKSFFERTWKYYCPVNYTHLFEKGICKYCNMRKDGNNRKEIYEKYKKIINETYVEQIEDYGKRFGYKIEQKQLLEVIKSQEIKLSDKTSFITKILEEKTSENIIIKITSFIYNVLNIELDKSLFIKAFIYMINNKLISTEELISNIRFIYEST